MILKNKEFGDLWFSYINIRLGMDYDIVEELAKIYSKNFGLYSNNNERNKRRIRLSTDRFMDLYGDNLAYFCSNIRGSILGYCTIHNIYKKSYIISVVTNLIIDKKYRKKDLAKNLLRYSIFRNDSIIRHGYGYQRGNDIDNYVCLYTVNPISLWVFDNVPGIENTNLYNCKSDVKESLQNYFIDNGYEVINNRMIRSCSDFGIYQDIEELEHNGYNDDLFDWYNGLMGKLDPTNEWFLLAKVVNLDELKFNN